MFYKGQIVRDNEGNQSRFENSPIREQGYGDSGVTRRNLESADEMPHGIDNDGNGEYNTDRNPD